MFHDLNASIKALLDGELSRNDVTVVFDGPGRNFPPSGVSLPVVSFFLYELRENFELRHGGWDDAKQGGAITRTWPPARMDCAYLITAWPKSGASGGPSPTADEYQLLGDVVKVLLRDRDLPDKYLKGELSGQSPPVRTRVLPDIELRDLGEFWQALGVTPRAAVRYGVTLTVDVSKPQPAGPLVKTKAINLTPTATP